MRTWSCKARSQGDNEISIQKNREPRYPIGMNSLNASSISIGSPRIPIILLSFAIRFYFWPCFVYTILFLEISPRSFESIRDWTPSLISMLENDVNIGCNKRTSFSTSMECVASKRTNRDEWTGRELAIFL